MTNMRIRKIRWATTPASVFDTSGFPNGVTVVNGVPMSLADESGVHAWSATLNAFAPMNEGLTIAGGSLQLPSYSAAGLAGDSQYTWLVTGKASTSTGGGIWKRASGADAWTRETTTYVGDGAEQAGGTKDPRPSKPTRVLLLQRNGSSVKDVFVSGMKNGPIWGVAKKADQTSGAAFADFFGQGESSTGIDVAEMREAVSGSGKFFAFCTSRKTGSAPARQGGAYIIDGASGSVTALAGASAASGTGLDDLLGGAFVVRTTAPAVAAGKTYYGHLIVANGSLGTSNIGYSVGIVRTDNVTGAFSMESWTDITADGAVLSVGNDASGFDCPTTVDAWEDTSHRLVIYGGVFANKTSTNLAVSLGGTLPDATGGNTSYYLAAARWRSNVNAETRLDGWVGASGAANITTQNMYGVTPATRWWQTAQGAFGKNKLCYGGYNHATSFLYHDPSTGYLYEAGTSGLYICTNPEAATPTFQPFTRGIAAAFCQDARVVVVGSSAVGVMFGDTDSGPTYIEGPTITGYTALRNFLADVLSSPSQPVTMWCCDVQPVASGNVTAYIGQCNRNNSSNGRIMKNTDLRTAGTFADVGPATASASSYALATGTAGKRPMGVRGFTDASSNTVVLVAVEGKGVARNVNGGNWPATPEYNSAGFIASKRRASILAADGSNNCAVYCGSGGLIVSSDAGATWTLVAGVNTTATSESGDAFWNNAHDTIYIVTTTGMQKVTSPFGGSPVVATWNNSLMTATTKCGSMWTDPVTGELTVYILPHDVNGAAIWTSADGGTTWTDITDDAFTEFAKPGLNIARYGNTLYVANEGAGLAQLVKG